MTASRRIRRLGGPTNVALHIVAEFERTWGPSEQAEHRAHVIVRELARYGLIPRVAIRNGLLVDGDEGANPFDLNAIQDELVRETMGSSSGTEGYSERPVRGFE